MEESESTYSSRDYSEKAAYSMIPMLCLSGKGKMMEHRGMTAGFLLYTCKPEVNGATALIYSKKTTTTNTYRSIFSKMYLKIKSEINFFRNSKVERIHQKSALL